MAAATAGPEPVITHSDVTTPMGLIADIAERGAAIRRVLEGDDGEEEDPEDVR